MTDSWAPNAAIRKSMQGNRGRDTAPEMAVRRLLHAQGFRYRVHVRPVQDVRRTADLVFPRMKVAVFIDGCYWHGCPEHYIAPMTNAFYWSDKVSANRARDIDTNTVLRSRGWSVYRFWEHQPPTAVAAEIAEALERLVL